MYNLPEGTGLFPQILASMANILANATPEERARWSVDLISSADGDTSPASHVRKTFGAAICHADEKLNELAADFDQAFEAAERKVASGSVGWRQKPKDRSGLQVVSTD